MKDNIKNKEKTSSSLSLPYRGSSICSSQHNFKSDTPPQQGENTHTHTFHLHTVGLHPIP